MRAHGSRLGKDELTAPWCARSFKRLHAMRITIALPCTARRRMRSCRRSSWTRLLMPYLACYSCLDVSERRCNLRRVPP